MDNFDFVGHLAKTSHSASQSVEIVEAFMRSYYREMDAVETKWRSRLTTGGKKMFSEVEAAFHKYWLTGTRFTEYWRPSMGNDYAIVGESGVVVYQDMLGNFVVLTTTARQTSAYLLSVIQDSLKIVNKFF
ncbi:MAG: hypothetical protein K8R36_08855 [Planctomycetales bacterium]|nr:hypothetical protein [Planctomycetales bacterium]